MIYQSIQYGAQIDISAGSRRIQQRLKFGMYLVHFCVAEHNGLIYDSYLVSKIQR